MYQKILKTHQNKAPKKIENLRKRMKSMKTHHQKHIQKEEYVNKRKNRKGIIRRTKPGRFLGHGEG